jgi:hypothetical protein
MTLEELYYVSQIVAVIAIFGSLVYVAIQTRQNSRMMRAKAAWDAETRLRRSTTCFPPAARSASCSTKL